jgi:copper chaperone CopZ
MKNKNLLLILLTLLISTTSFTPMERDEMTIEFITLGNCYYCKLRIEEKLSNVEGVISSEYDASNHITTVTYDDLITDAFFILQAVADTGHDNEWYEAPQEAYDLLIGTCCEYDRTIDYSTVQVGYLSLMDLWMPHVAVGELKEEQNISIFPTVSSGQYSVRFNKLSALVNPEIRIYSMNGGLVWANSVVAGVETEINISIAPAGQYVLCTFDDGEIISRSKIIKQ